MHCKLKFKNCKLSSLISGNCVNCVGILGFANSWTCMRGLQGFAQGLMICRIIAYKKL